MDDPVQAWTDGGLLATIRAKSVVSWLRTLLWAIVGLGVLTAVGVLTDSDGEATAKVAALIIDVVAVLMSVAFLAAVASGLELLRVQTESVLFADDE